MDNRKHVSKQKKTMIAVLVALLLVVAAAGIILLFSRLEQRADRAPEGAGTDPTRTLLTEADAAIAEELDLDLTTEDEYPVYEEPEDVPTITYRGQKYIYNDDLSVLLIMGIDDDEIEESAGYRNTGLCDVLLVAVFDPSDHTCKLIQINRDTMADVPVLGFSGRYLGITTEQLAYAHTYGKGLEDSAENTVHAISRFLYETPIDNYFVLTMDAIAILNDAVGGVDVLIEDDFTGVDDTFIQGETITLMGDHAENYVRARFNMQDDPTNIARMRRQRTYMLSLIDKIQAAQNADPGFILNVYGDVSDYVLTDCSLDQLDGYSKQFSSYTLTDILVPEGESVRGERYMEFYVDEAALQQMVIETFYIPVTE